MLVSSGLSQDNITAQYSAFPYPEVRSIEAEDPTRSLLKSFNLKHNLPPRRHLKEGARVWVPGCGTRWAVMLALQWKDVEILATDVSPSSLAKQEALAQQLGINNVRFDLQDVCEA